LNQTNTTDHEYSTTLGMPSHTLSTDLIEDSPAPTAALLLQMKTNFIDAKITRPL